MTIWKRIGSGLATAGRAVRSFVTGRPAPVAAEVAQAKPKRASGVVLRCLVWLRDREWTGDVRFSAGEIAAALSEPLVTVNGALRYCRRAGFAKRGEDGRWAITALGSRRVQHGGGRVRVRRAELGPA